MLKTASRFMPKTINDPYGKVGANWFWVDFNFEKYFTLGGMDLTFMVEVKNIFNDLNSDIINPVTGRAYQLGDPVPPTWNDPRYPELTAPIDPYPLDPSRYLTAEKYQSRSFGEAMMKSQNSKVRSKMQRQIRELLFLTCKLPLAFVILHA